MVRVSGWLIGVAVFVLSAGSASAEVDPLAEGSLIVPAPPQNGQSSPPTEFQGFFLDQFDALESQRDRMSQRFFRMGRGLDRYLAGGDYEIEDLNQTYVRVRLANTLRQHEAPQDDSDIKFRFDLPSTKRRFRLIFENETEDATFARNQSTPNQLSGGNFEREGMSAAVRMAVMDLAHWKSDFDAGIRGTIPLDPFARHTLRRSWELDDDWSSRVRSRLAYFNSDGYDYNLQWSFDRQLDDDLAFRTVTEADWEQKYDQLAWGQVLGTTHFITDRVLLDHAVGAAGSSLSHTRVDVYYYAFTHRQFLHEDWLILDLVPQVDWAREREFHSSLSFTVRLELLFFENSPF